MNETLAHQSIVFQGTRRREGKRHKKVEPEGSRRDQQGLAKGMRL